MSEINLIDVIHSDGTTSQQMQIVYEDGSSTIFIKEVYDAQLAAQEVTPNAN